MTGTGRSILKDLAAEILWTLGVTAPSRRARGRLSIVTFHRVLPSSLREAYPFPGLAVTPEELRWFLSFFTRWFRCLTLEEAMEIPRERWKEGRPLLSVTFDDGQKDNFLYGRPVLNELGVPATFFVPAGSVGGEAPLWHDRMGYSIQRIERSGEGRARSILEEFGVSVPGGTSLPYAAVWAAKKMAPPERARFLKTVEDAAAGGRRPEWDGLMGRDELRILAEEGHEIGSHSMTHPILTDLEGDALDREVEGSRKRLEDVMGGRVSSFSYPNGDHHQGVVRAVRRAGYSQAVATTWGNNPPSADPFRLRRLEMDARRIAGRGGRWSPAILAWRMSGLYPGLRFS